MALAVLLGGARSGKSQIAVRLAAARDRPVVVVATGEAGDEEMTERIAAHRAERPDHWTTVEEPLALAKVLRSAPDDAVVLVDCLTLWVANLMGSGHRDIEGAGRDAARLAAAHPGGAIAVSNEVGSGIVPDLPEARRYRDLLGRVNAAWVAEATRAGLVVAGRVIPLSGAEEVFGG